MKRTLIALLATAGVLSAQDAASFPTAPIKLIVPFSAGGATDAIARSVAQNMQKELGKPVVVDNRPGAAGIIGVTGAIASPADGHTILLGSNGPISINPALYPKLAYNPTKDLVPVAGIAKLPFVVVAGTKFAPKNIQELVAQAKKEPGKMNYASSGVGTTAHLAAEMIQARSGTEFTHVPYKGAAPALTDVIGGSVDFMVGDVSTVTPMLKGGKAKALAVTGAKRVPSLPNVPTMDESGLKGFEASGWFGVFAPAKTPPAVIAALAKAIQAAQQQPDLKERVSSLGGDVMPLVGAEFQAFLKAESEKWAGIIKSNKITAESP
jgi:tripartite-type tricarboxylate transporter receptor subunit TctC